MLVCGQFRQKAKLVLFVALVSLIPFYSCCGWILAALGQNKEVSHLAGYFIIYYVPGTVMMALVDIDRILLTNLDQTYNAMLCQIFTPILHFCFIYLFTIAIDFGTTGIALTYFLTNSMIYLIQLTLIAHTPEAEEIYQVPFFDRDNFRHMKQYMDVAGPAVISMLAEFAVFDIQIFLMGEVDLESQASMIIFMNLSTQIFSIYYGLQNACSTLVGQYIGKGDAQKAK